MLRFAAATASSVLRLMLLMPLWHKPYMTSSTRESTDAVCASCTSIHPLWKAGQQNRGSIRCCVFFFFYCNVQGWRISRCRGGKDSGKFLQSTKHFRLPVDHCPTQGSLILSGIHSTQRSQVFNQVYFNLLPIISAKTLTVFCADTHSNSLWDPRGHNNTIGATLKCSVERHITCTTSPE